jgi:predicted cupin superfamily sugar epimerase
METHKASYWINHLSLHPHPEGGFYKETFRSKTEVLRNPPKGVKQAFTSIHYLLSGADYSGFHRIASDEAWYFHKGAPLHIHAIDEEGTLTTYELSDSATGNLSVVIEAGLWFAAELPAKHGFTLVSCAVAPGFDFSEFEMAKKQVMLTKYPQHSLLIDKFCRL